MSGEIIGTILSSPEVFAENAESPRVWGERRRTVCMEAGDIQRWMMMCKEIERGTEMTI
jgi:hypothetical protein